MTCKNCIGYKFCSRGRNGQTNFYGTEVACNNVEFLCPDFKNKADFVEVVRCKVCKKFMPYEGEEHKGDCEEFPELQCCFYEDDFCSYGERRAEE